MDLNTLEKLVYVNIVFDYSFIKKLRIKCDIIYNSEKFLNTFGLGNRSERNGSLFTGNLLLKSSIFIELAVVLQKFIESNNLRNYCLSEFFLVSTNKYSKSSDWWHRDYPHNLENFELYNKHSIGFFVPVSTFNDSTGSTRVIEYSNNNLKLSANFENTKILSANKGDLIIYNPRIMHTGGSNKTDKTRQLIVAIFNRKELIPCENFVIQKDMIFTEKDKKLIKELKLIRYKPIINFFGRNRTIINTSLRPIVKVFNRIKIKINWFYSFTYFFWTRSLYTFFNLIKKF